MASGGDPGGARRRWRRRIAAIAVALLALLALEGVVRLLPWGAPSREEFYRRHGLISIERYYSAHERYFVEVEGGDEVRTCGPGESLARDPADASSGMRWSRFPCDKTEGHFRIVTLGGSSTRGWGVDADQDFSAQLQERLAARTTVPVEVINAGVAGHNTIQIRSLIPDLRELAPDLLLLYAGHNDYNFFIVANAAELTPRWVRQLRAAGDRLALWRAARSLLFRIRPPRGAPAGMHAGGHGVPGAASRLAVVGDGPRKTPGSRSGRLEMVAEEEEARRLIDTRYRESIRLLAAAARKMDAELVVAAPVCDLGSRPLDSIHWKDLTDEELGRWEQAYQRSRDERPGEPQVPPHERQQAVEEALAIDDSYASLRYLVAARLARTGRVDEAREHQIAALDLVPPSRCDLAPPRHAAVVAAAADDVGALYVDPWPAFEAAGPRGGRGTELFVDSLHPSVAGHALLADLFADSIEEAGLLPAD